MTRNKNYGGVGFVFTLTEAVVQAVRILGLDAETMAAILQTDLENAASILAGRGVLSPARQGEWQRATDFVRLYCMLETMNAKHDSGKSWLRHPHQLLDARPIDCLLQADGLNRLLDCIDHEKRLNCDMTLADANAHDAGRVAA